MVSERANGLLLLLKKLFTNREFLEIAAGGAGLRFVGLILGLVLSVLLGRWLGPAEFGRYALAMSVVSWAVLIAAPGIPLLVLRETALYDRVGSMGLVRGLALRAQQYTIVSSLIILLIGQLTLTLLGWSSLSPYDTISRGLWIVPPLALLSVNASLLLGLRRLTWSVATETLLRNIIFIFGSLAIVNFDSLTALAALNLQFLCCIVALVFSSYILVRVVKLGHAEFETRRWLSLTGSFSAIAVLGFINIEFVSLFLGFSHPTSELAQFRVTLTLALMVSFPLTIVESLATPYIARFFGKRDYESLAQSMRLCALASFSISAVPAIILVVFGRSIIAIMYGGGYEPAYEPLIILCIAYLLTNFLGLSLQLLYATNFSNEAAKLGFYGALVNVVLCLLLVPSFGALGAAGALGLGKVMRSLLYLSAVHRYLHISTTVFGIFKRA